MSPPSYSFSTASSSFISPVVNLYTLIKPILSPSLSKKLNSELPQVLEVTASPSLSRLVAFNLNDLPFNTTFP